MTTTTTTTAAAATTVAALTNILWTSASNTINTISMASRTFLEHYIAYLTSWKGFLAVIFVAVLSWGVWSERRRRLARARLERKDVVSGCFRLGLYGRSELDDQYLEEGNSRRRQHDHHYGEKQQRAVVKAIFVYPIKSCGGVELQRGGIISTGMVCDRIFSFAQLVSTDTTHEWRFITQRQFPKLALLQTELWLPDVEQVSENTELDKIGSWSMNGGCVVVRFPYPTDARYGSSAETVTIRLPLNATYERSRAKQYVEENVTIWTDRPLAINITNEIDPNSLAKLKYFLGVSNPLGLFKQHDDQLRRISRSLPPNSADQDYRVGFPDAFPIHIMNMASIRDIDASLPDETASKGRLDARRFRANIYVSGPDAYTEDRWKRIAIGNTASENGRQSIPAEFHAACRTARCQLPNVDPLTGIKVYISLHLLVIIV